MCFRADSVQNSLHEQRDPHVDWDELADGNSEGVSTGPEENSQMNHSDHSHQSTKIPLCGAFTLYLFYSTTFI